MILDLPKRQKVLWVCKQFLKKPAKKYINIQEGGEGGGETQKTINFGSKLSFILYFLFPERLHYGLHIFSLLLLVQLL